MFVGNAVPLLERLVCVFLLFWRVFGVWICNPLYFDDGFWLCCLFFWPVFLAIFMYINSTVFVSCSIFMLLYASSNNELAPVTTNKSSWCYYHVLDIVFVIIWGLVLLSLYLLLHLPHRVQCPDLYYLTFSSFQ